MAAAGVNQLRKERTPAQRIRKRTVLRNLAASGARMTALRRQAHCTATARKAQTRRVQHTTPLRAPQEITRGAKMQMAQAGARMTQGISVPFTMQRIAKRLEKFGAPCIRT